ncbi:MAG: hypothetical protein OCD00_14975 [Colwellia sp.]
MSPSQLKTLQELSYAFSQGKASPKQIQQLSTLLAEINQYVVSSVSIDKSHKNLLIAEPRASL